MTVRELAQSMKNYAGRDWRDHWERLLQDPRTDEWARRIARQALANLGHPQREPGEDDA